MDGRSRQASEVTAERQRAAGIPVTFSDVPGLFQPALHGSTDTAVLFVSPWGLEELCTHKFWRVLAERLSDRGIASLRFDLPGTGDALDMNEPSLAVWQDCLVSAAERLHLISGCERLLVISHGLGSLLTLNTVERLSGLAGVACLAPVTSGRAYLRELQIWSRMVDEGLGLREEDRIRDKVSIAGFIMPDTVAAGVKALAPPAFTAKPFEHALFATRPERTAEAEVAASLQSTGVSVQRVDYAGYDAFISNPLISVLPESVGKTVVDWAVGLAQPGGVASQTKIPAAEPLVSDVFRETPVTFGDHDRLFGILCEPVGERTGATAIILGTAYDRSSGWGGSGVDMARKLAMQGIASLRFDAANVGDSPPVPGAAGQVLYQDAQRLDVRAAVDFLEARHLLPAVVGGRCSGSYLAFRSAAGDDRITGLVAANPYAFLWDPAVDVDTVLHAGPRQLHEYRERLFKLQTLQRLLKGQVDVRTAGLNVMRSLGRKVGRRFQPLLRLLPGTGDAHRDIRRSFQSLRDRQAPFELIYSEKDIGLIHFAEHFGKQGEGLSRYPNVRLTMLADTDHNLTPPAARQVFLDAMRRVALDR